MGKLIICSCFVFLCFIVVKSYGASHDKIDMKIGSYLQCSNACGTAKTIKIVKAGLYNYCYCSNNHVIQQRREDASSINE